LDDCPNTAIQMNSLSLATMVYTATKQASTQQFQLATDSRSQLIGISEQCGPFEYSIL
jgi:hypothetical protein